MAMVGAALAVARARLSSNASIMANVLQIADALYAGSMAEADSMAAAMEAEDHDEFDEAPAE